MAKNLIPKLDVNTPYDEGYKKGQIGLLGSILAQIEFDVCEWVEAAARYKKKGAKNKDMRIHLEGKICALTDLQERLKMAYEKKLDRKHEMSLYKL